MKKMLRSLLLLTILTGIHSLRAQSVYSDFTTNADGWTISGTIGSYNPDFDSTNGNPGAYIAKDNGIDPGVWYFRAPSKYLGNKSAAYNRSISFDLLITDTTDFYTNNANLLIYSPGKILSINLTKDTLPGLWQQFIVTLNENSGWHLGSLTGPLATHQNMIDVLSNITDIFIKGKFNTNDGSGGIDNVFLSTSSPISTFDTDYEGWRVKGDVQHGSGMPNYHSTGGHPGGYLSAVDDATGDTWYWQAPGNFLGNKAGTYGQYLKFEIKQSGLDSQFDDYDLILQGPTFNLVFNTPNNPDTTWTSYSIQMTESAGWRITDTLGEVPSKSEFISVLSDLQNLLIRGEFISGPDSGCIDNVVFGNVSEVPEHEVASGQMLLFPNPAKENLNLALDVEQGGFYTFSLTGISGEQGVMQHRFYLSPGKQFLKVSLGIVPSGLYIAEMRNESTVFRGKVVVE